MALVETLVDNFDDNSKNASLWVDPVVTLPLYVPVFGGLGGTISETGGKLSLTGAVSNAGRGNGYFSVDTALDLRSSSVYLRLDTVPTAGGQGILLTFALAQGGTSSERVNWLIDNNFGTVTLSAESNNFGDNGGGAFSVAYSPTDHRWLRFRHDNTAGGTIYWDTAPDSAGGPGAPGTWVNRRTLASASSGYFSPTGVQVGIAVGMVTSNASPLSFIVDNLNTSASGGNAARAANHYRRRRAA